MKNSPRNLGAYCKLVTFRKIDLARDRGSAIVNTVLVYAALIFCHPEPTLQRKEKQDGISPHQRGFSKRGNFYRNAKSEQELSEAEGDFSPRCQFAALRLNAFRTNEFIHNLAILFLRCSLCCF